MNLTQFRGLKASIRPSGATDVCANAQRARYRGGLRFEPVSNPSRSLPTPATALGDVLLYWLGAGARRIKWLEKRYITAETHKVTESLHNHLISATLLARVIPGLRLFTYTACGFTKVSLVRFTVWVVIAVLAWTASLFWLSATMGHALAALLGVPESVAVTLPIIAIALAFPAYKYFKQHRKSNNPSTKNE